MPIISGFFCSSIILFTFIVAFFATRKPEKKRKRLVPKDLFVRRQNKLKTMMITSTRIPNLSMDGTLKGLELVGGLDISFDKTDPFGDRAVATLTVLSFPSLRTILTVNRHVNLTVPYRDGFLGFREVPAFRDAWNQMQHYTRSLPQVVLVDGNGLLHP